MHPVRGVIGCERYDDEDASEMDDAVTGHCPLYEHLGVKRRQEEEEEE
ncbi:hypothetical protein [Prosthecobacter sp.]